MLSIRMQRTGRKGYPTYRVVVQESQRTPTSGRYVAILGNYNPHTKEAKLEKEKAEFYLKNGAQPTPRVINLLKAQKVSVPAWVKTESKQKKAVKNLEKLRKNRPAEEAKPAETPAVESPAEPTETPADDKQPAEANDEDIDSKPEETAKTEEVETEKEATDDVETTEKDKSEEPKQQ